MKKLFAFTVVLVLFYFSKIMSSIFVILSDPELIKQFKQEILLIRQDEKDGESQNCLGETYPRCKLIFGWNFFEKQQYVDFSLGLLSFIFMLYVTHKYRLMQIKISQFKAIQNIIELNESKNYLKKPSQVE